VIRQGFADVPYYAEAMPTNAENPKPSSLGATSVMSLRM